MNAEIMKIRKNRNVNIEVHGEPKRLEENQLLQVLYDMNCNLTTLYQNQKSNSLDDYIDIFSKNIYIILKIFDEMGVYPDYFYDILFKERIEFQRFANNMSSYDSYDLRKKYSPITSVSKLTREGIRKKYYRVQALKDRSLNDYFVEMISFYQGLNLPFNKKDDESVKKSFNKAFNRIVEITQSLYTSDFLFEDIELLVKLLFHYMSFFVEIGINPQEYVDNYINDEVKTIKK